MTKAYLAHSSSDKKRFIEPIAKKFGKDRCVYDDYTFEEGMKSIEEIERCLEQTDLFVLFISEAALLSDWVKTEINKAHKLLNTGSIQRIYPVIIDQNISYDDSRLPDWLRDYNLKYIGRTTVAFRRISSRLREISWNFHPRLKERNEIFVGRNDLLKILEERLDSMEQPTPTCIVASGIKRIGRSTFLTRCLRKTNITSDSYRALNIIMNRYESIEDFIYKIYDLGLSTNTKFHNLSGIRMEEKIKIAASLLLDFEILKERLMVIDDGCIIRNGGEVATWFLDILSAVKGKNYIFLMLASRQRIINFPRNFRDDIFTVRVPELTVRERAGLLKRYLDFEEVSLSMDDFNIFTGLLNGFPEQAHYAVDLIKELGLVQAKKNSYLVREFNQERVASIIQEYEGNDFALNLLRLLSEFEMVSYDLLIFIVGEEKQVMELLEKFFISCICEYVGPSNDYVKLNDTVRDHINRIKLELPVNFKNKISEHVEDFICNYDPENVDAPDFMYSLKKALLEGKKIDEELLIPSHYLKTLKEAYDSRKYSEVIQLADMVLSKDSFSVVNIDPSIIFQIRYQLCLSLARTRNSRFKDEVMKIKGIEHNFLFGYYYRLIGKTELAVERYSKVLEENPYHSRAKRELVQVYLQESNFEKAEKLAKQNYMFDVYNSFHIQAYFKCLIEKRHIPGNIDIIKELMEKLKRIKSKHAIEVLLISEMQYLSLIANLKKEALNKTDQALSSCPESVYVKFAVFEVYEKYSLVDKMQEMVGELEKNIDSNSNLYHSMIYKKAVCMSKCGQKVEAIRLIDSQLKHLSDDLRERYKASLTKSESV